MNHDISIHDGEAMKGCGYMSIPDKLNLMQTMYYEIDEHLSWYEDCLTAEDFSEVNSALNSITYLIDHVYDIFKEAEAIKPELTEQRWWLGQL